MALSLPLPLKTAGTPRPRSPTPPHHRHRLTTTATAAVAAVAAVVVAALARPTAAHSFLTYPPPISNDKVCRVGGPPYFSKNCGGPCPWEHLLANPPVTTTARGASLHVRYSRNNHDGGFVRWSLVPLWAASSKLYHARAAFHYGCWSAGEFRCKPGSAEFRRDCAEDRRGTAYRGSLRVPPHLPDGEYVLGFVWYGGYVGDHHSEFGDYYDCARVRVRGGVRQEWSHTPTWAAGPGEFSDSCRASVNRVGTCWREPCKGFQGGRLKPEEFSNGRSPPPVLASLFRPGFNVAGLRPVAPIPQNRGAARAPPFNPFASVTVGAPLRLNGISLLHPPSAREVWRLLPTWPPPLRLPVGGGGVSLSASVSGDIRAVEWYVWGRQVRVERAHPYTIAGDKRGRVFVWRGGGRWGGEGPVTVRVRLVGITGRVLERTWHLRFYR